MAARRTAQTGQPKSTHTNERDGATPPCLMNPDCSAEFARIAANYGHLAERIDRLDTAMSASIDRLQRYLKEEYAESINFRVDALSTRLATAEEQVRAVRVTLTGLSRRAIYAAGGLAAIAFVLGLIASALPVLAGA